ncbi:MAG: restriction endonuclease subunit S [Acinetobacter johnsonii]|nr:restriction endonuclease subunit S [Acinetobacter johnsonii]
MAVPKLRFNEFDGGWSNKKIGEIAVVTSGGTPSRNIPKYWNGHIPWVTTSLVDFNIINNAEEFITQDGVDNSSAKLFPKNTILMAMYGQGITRGKVAILGIDATTNQACAAIKLRDGIDIHFVFQNLMNRYEEIRDLSNEGGQKNLSAGIIKDISISYPSKPEQTKIASFLSAVDEKISQLTQKHALLSQYKQGMMQKLFSQQIRFKADDGSEFGEWENKTLSNFIIKHIGGASLKPSDFVEQSEYEVIPKKAIVPNGYLNLDKDNPTYCSEDFFKANLKNTVDNTYLVTVLRDLVPSGPSIGYIVKYMENTQYILAQGVYGFKLKEELNKDFLIHFSNTKAYRLVMQSIMVGSTQVHIRNQDFFGIEIPVPCLEEQTKIANFLSAIDQKIEVVAQQIEQAKTWKKGLLQQMFV